jgi:Grx4 family monothiol glutaredoxin
MLTPELAQKIKSLISQYRVMLFMKGTPESPQCGFSANAVALLVEGGIYFESFDIYSDEEIRQWLKEYSNWPTYPQLYIDGELIWGIDIMMEMFESWELEALKQENTL